MKTKVNINLNEKQSQTQKEQIRKYLLSGRSITPIEALNKFGCFRLGARIYELKKPPYNLNIQRTIIITKTGKKVACYKLIKNI